MFSTPKTVHMDGNPHYARATQLLDSAANARAALAQDIQDGKVNQPTTMAGIALLDSTIRQVQIEATLALAFEQRTATLVELRSDTRFVAKHIDAVQSRIHGGLDLG